MLAGYQMGNVSMSLAGWLALAPLAALGSASENSANGRTSTFAVVSISSL